MPVIGPSTPVFTYYPDSPPSILGELVTGLTVTIELWKGETLVELAEGANVCEEVGNTGVYAWSTANLPPMRSGIEQFHYRMTGNDATQDEGDFILEADRIDAMPSLTDRASYIMDPRP
jgi:hypothetical protein